MPKYTAKVCAVQDLAAFPYATLASLTPPAFTYLLWYLLFGLLPTFIFMFYLFTHSLDVYRIRRLFDREAVPYRPVFRLPYNRRLQHNLLTHVRHYFAVWIKFGFFMLLKYSRPRCQFALRWFRRRLRHGAWSRLWGAALPLGTNKDDDNWLRDQNWKLYGDLTMFNQRSIYPIVGDRDTFIDFEQVRLPEWRVYDFGDDDEDCFDHIERWRHRFLASFEIPLPRWRLHRGRQVGDQPQQEQRGGKQQQQALQASVVDEAEEEAQQQQPNTTPRPSVQFETSPGETEEEALSRKASRDSAEGASEQDQQQDKGKDSAAEAKLKGILKSTNPNQTEEEQRIEAEAASKETFVFGRKDSTRGSQSL